MGINGDVREIEEFLGIREVDNFGDIKRILDQSCISLGPNGFPDTKGREKLLSVNGERDTVNLGYKLFSFLVVEVNQGLYLIINKEEGVVKLVLRYIKKVGFYWHGNTKVFCILYMGNVAKGK